MNNFQEFQNATAASISEFNSFVKKHQLKEDSKIDHICYKCESSEVFESIRKMFESESQYIFQSIISKRRISYVKFKTPIETDLGPIWFLELSDQKPDGSQKNMFDHVEIYSTKMGYDEFAKVFEDAGEKLEKIAKPHHTTYELKLTSGFEVKVCEEPLIEKIKREEML